MSHSKKQKAEYIITAPVFEESLGVWKCIIFGNDAYEANFNAKVREAAQDLYEAANGILSKINECDDDGCTMSEFVQRSEKELKNLANSLNKANN